MGKCGLAGQSRLTTRLKFWANATPIFFEGQTSATPGSAKFSLPGADPPVQQIGRLTLCSCNDVADHVARRSN
jgi:hypothetical protein